jgi:hypothetical protein
MSEGTPQAIEEVCDSIKHLLLRKNQMYGDSALNPRRVFSDSSPVEQLLVRIDDKLSRIGKAGFHGDGDEDTLDDLIGYLVLLKVALREPADPLDMNRHPRGKR